MKIQESLMRVVLRLWGHLSRRRQIQLWLLLLAMAGASFAEIINIGALLPFLAALTAPEQILTEPRLQPIISALGITTPAQALLMLFVAFGVAITLAGAMRLLLFWATTKMSYVIGADISIEIYRRTLYQPYAVHVGRNSSEIIDGITGKTNLATLMITMMANLLGATFMMVAIVLTLMVIDPVVTLAAFAGFSAIYLFIIRLTRARLQSNSQRVARGSTDLIKSLQEGLGGVRDVILDGSQPVFIGLYRNADRRLRDALASSVFISMSPRYLLETLGMLLIAGLAYWLTQGMSGTSQVIPVLGAMALGAQRALPILQQAYAAITTIRGGQASLADVVDLLDQPLPAHLGSPLLPPMPFRRAICLDGVSFQYAEGTPKVLKDIQLDIPKGSRIGFFGTTGAGKSTLVDVVMGLLEPSAGALTVDGVPVTAANQRAWQAHVAHVPQSIFLTDSSVEENIAFGQPSDMIDRDLVVSAAERAQIAEVINAMPLGYATKVGERGIKLSGGQRQRIGIARALYKKADVIILDEATSALDAQTEDAVMHAIDGLGHDLTILMVAHRTTTLRKCDVVVELEGGSIKRLGRYDELVGEVHQTPATEKQS